MAAPPDKLPAHQQLPQGSGGQQAEQVWMYPSEQMFYNAMQRKGWQPAAQDMSTVVAIHNSVNERAWAEVKAWEALHCADCPQGPRLVRFQGRPADLSPKARLLNALGYALPFDRHDWVVDRCGHQVRYVIDFYAGVPQPGGPPAAMFLDTRPALDSFGAAWDRIVMQARWMTRGMWQ
ncbi:cytochrome c/c1 heme-lyase [Haematococcus lacustris]